MTKDVILSLGLTTIVGLSMGLGSLLSFIVDETNKRFLALSLSFSAGIMIYVSFMAILPEGMELIESYTGKHSSIIALTGFFGGMLITALIEKLVHKFGGHIHGHHHGEHKNVEEHDDEHLSKQGKALR